MEEKKPKKKRKKKSAAEGDGTQEKEHKKSWQEMYATVEDIKAFLGGRLYLRHNVITRRVECRLPSNYETDGTDWQPISDRVVNSLWVELSKEKPVRAQDIYRVLESDFVEEYHPFRYYLDHLPPWDGDDYIIELSVSVTIRGGVEKQMLFYEYLTKWLTANQVGRAMTDLGFERVRSHGVRGYIVVPYSAEEMEARKRMLAYDARPESEAGNDANDEFDEIF